MGGGVSQEALVNVVNNMVADIFVNIALYCNSTNTSSQTILIECNPANITPTSNTVYELNSACNNCLQNVVANHLNYYQFQQQLWENGDIVPSVKKPIDSDYQAAINEFVSCTTTHCKACVAQNLSQKTVVKSVTSCAAFNNVKNTIDQQLMAQITQQLTNNQDMLAPLAEMLGASTTNDIVYNITNRISSKITDNVISNIQNQISSQQSIVLNQSSGNDSGMTQESSFHSVQSYLEKTNIFNDILEKSQWDLLQNLVNEQNTIDSLGNTVVKAVGYLSKLLTDVVGKVVLFIMIMVGVIFVGIVIYIITHLIQKEVRKQHEKDLVMEEKSEKVPVFETF
jgi:hypothetical protein